MFAELFAKTNYSFLEGASHPEEMVAMARHLNYCAIGITDRNGFYGIPRAHMAALQAGIPLIIGAEVTLEKGGTAFLLVKNKNGYGNLCELLTYLHCEREEKVTWEDILKYSSDLFLCLPPKLLDNPLESLPWEQLKAAFPQSIYLIAHRYLDGKDLSTLKAVLHYSEDLGIPCVVSNQPLFHHPQRKPLQDVLTCIRHTCTLKDGGYRLLANAERTLKPEQEIRKLFSDFPEWVDNTTRLAKSCQFSLSEIHYHYPNEWIPQGETGDSFLAKLTWEGASKRYANDIPENAKAQIQKELELIKLLNYSDYFLTIWDIVQFAQRQQILYQGRGSAANSIVCYVLGITAIDPVRMDLLFERFISVERKEPPDIDIDFEHERREEVIQYIYDRYGRHRAAITAEVICYRKKSSLREVAKVFNISTSIVGQLLVLTHRKSLEEVTIAELEKAIPEVPAKTLKQYYATASELLCFPRHLGTHVGGFVLCSDQLSRNIPIEKAAMPGRTIVQWDKNDLDSLGFIKVDILGLGILTAIRKSFDIIKKTHGVSLGLISVPPEDPKVYAAFEKGDTVGVFQIESRAQMNMLPRLRPKNFYDLVVEISLVRPGPIQGDMVHPYLRRREGKEPVEYAHPDLEAILKKTFGVPLFQEQIMKMAMVVADFTAGEADKLRRAMGTWRRHGKNRLTHMGEKFCRGLIKKGIRKDFAERIFTQIEGFAEYGFPESHAASFAILAYVSGYLHFYYPDAYLTALLNAQPMGFYQPHTLIHDGQRHGVEILPIDINHSNWDNLCSKPGQVRLGFREIKGFPERTALAIEKARAIGPFESILDFAIRVRQMLQPIALTKRELFFLAGSHAFELKGSSLIQRRDAFWEIQALPLQDSQILSTKENQVILPKETSWEKVSLDYDYQGVSLYAHPMALFRDSLTTQGVLASSGLRSPASRFLKSRRKIAVAGMVICRQMPPTASGVLFITLEDEFGFINLVIWHSVYEKFRELLITHSFLKCEGYVEKAEGTEVTHLIVESVTTLLPSSCLPSVSRDFH